MLGIMGSQRLRYPATAFDMAHCSRCLIPWSDYGLEVATNIYQHAAANTSAVAWHKVYAIQANYSGLLISLTHMHEAVTPGLCNSKCAAGA
ncbi:hypothetical protein ACET3Z_010194 [Daucus carota]